VEQGGGVENGDAIVGLKAQQAPETALVDSVTTGGPSIGLVNQSHAFQHQECQMTSDLPQLGPNLGAHGASLTDERGRNRDLGIGQAAAGGKSGTEGLPHTDATNMIHRTARQERLGIQVEPGAGKNT
jgi:hypothetical protein